MAASVEGASSAVLPTDQSSEEEDEDYSSGPEGSSEEEFAPLSWRRSRFWQSAGIVSVVTFLLVCRMASASLRHDDLGQKPEPLTVQSLLEGVELVEVATDNLMTIGGLKNADRDRVRNNVAQSLQNISLSIQENHPEAHRRLRGLVLSQRQKDAALQVLCRNFGDSRMVGITRDVVDAAHESHGGDQRVLRRRLLEKLLPRVTEMQQLREELYPSGTSGRGDSDFKIKGNGQLLDLDLSSSSPQKTEAGDSERWRLNVEVDLGSRAESAGVQARRLAMLGSLAGGLAGVRAQAGTLFRTLEAKLGDEMPKAPGRMLAAPSIYKEPAMGDVDDSFVNCVRQAVPNPMEVCECIASHMEEVMEMMLAFVQEHL